MMASEEKQTDEVSKMEESVSEKGTEETETKQEASADTAKEQEKEVKMEVEDTPAEDSSKVMTEVPMETEPAPPQTKEESPKIEENPKMEETSVKDDSREQETINEEDKVQDKVTEEKADDELEKQTICEDKETEVKTTSPPDPVPCNDEAVEATEELDEDWDVLGTDDEKDETRKKKTSGVWMPDVNVIIDLYQKLDKEGVLELQWKCPGRRPPPEEIDEKKEETPMTETELEKPEAKEEKQEEEPTEFDFDVDAPSVTNMAPRRTPGSGQALGSGKKRVARMDKIFDDMLRHKRIDEELARVGDEADDTLNRTDTTPQRPVGKFRIRKDF
ncbi:PAXIP1-associated glutamate-rich protein 1-like [Acanthaster planci]|uniref:PAXIP1-associated glutamate-rich protein 1-like n=1 Tax=Acanthaster planci TaxID=133434 RepID=A0A8B7XZD6_ACAPL|nr:PAXIP1-associated glutamate-rich protein 1-like [Acanthaster planci]